MPGATRCRGSTCGAAALWPRQQSSTVATQHRHESCYGQHKTLAKGLPVQRSSHYTCTCQYEDSSEVMPAGSTERHACVGSAACGRTAGGRTAADCVGSMTTLPSAWTPMPFIVQHSSTLTQAAHTLQEHAGAHTAHQPDLEFEHTAGGTYTVAAGAGAIAAVARPCDTSGACGRCRASELAIISSTCQDMRRLHGFMATNLAGSW